MQRLPEEGIWKKREIRQEIFGILSLLHFGPLRLLPVLVK